MGASNSTQQNKKFYALKSKVSETDTPVFVLTEKVDGSWKQTGSFDTMEGMINSAKITQKESTKAGKFNVFTFDFDDGKELSQVEFTHNSITYSFLNSLASNINKLDTYKVQVYKKQSKGTDGKMYWNGQVSIRVNKSDDMQKWYVDPQSTPKKEKMLRPDGTPFMQNGKQVYDDTKVKEYWENFFNQNILLKLGSKVDSNISTSSTTKEELPTDGSLDDLPF